jgi:topoisomerase-4 subunit A
VQLAAGVTADQTIDALYAFTNCEVSISPNTCVIVDNKPLFLTATDLLKLSTDHTKDLLLKELQIRLSELQDKWHYTSLEKIFFEEKLYKELEKKHETWDKVLIAIEKGFEPYIKQLKRDVTREDVVKLTEKPVRRIYKLDIDELNEQIKNLEEEIKKTNTNIDNLNDFSIAYFEDLLKKYGKGRERKTELKVFDTIQVNEIAIANTKLFINKADGFIGTSLKKDEFLFDCADIDSIIAFTADGKMKVVKVGDKMFIGKDIINAEIFKKNDERTTYNMIYADGKTGVAYAKRFNVTGVTRDKEYDLTKGSPKSKVLYYTSNANGESEVVTINLSAASKSRTKTFEFDFEELAIKGRSSIGNQVTKHQIKNIKQKRKGTSTLGGKKIWYDDVVGRLNLDENGMYLGSFNEEDKIVVVYNDGNYVLTSTELSNRYDAEKIVMIEKYKPDAVVSAVYFDADKSQFNIKRFKIETSTIGNKYLFIKEGEGNYLEWITTKPSPTIKLKTGKKKFLPSEQEIVLEEFIDVMGWKAIGNKLCEKDLLEINIVGEEEDDSKQGELF